MTTYYICRDYDVAELNIAQDNEQKLACEIIKAARIYDEIKSELVAIYADSENGTYAQLKNTALYSMKLDSSGIELWETYGRRIFDYLLDPTEDCSELWSAYGVLSSTISEYEELCAESSAFSDLAEGFAESMDVHLDENIREEQSTFAGIMEDVYEIEEINLVTS